MTDPAQNQYVSIQQACALAGVSRRSIYNWLARGKLIYRRTAGGSVRIEAATLFRGARAVPAVSGVLSPLEPALPSPLVASPANFDRATCADRPTADARLDARMDDLKAERDALRAELATVRHQHAREDATLRQALAHAQRAVTTRSFADQLRADGVEREVEP